MNKEKALEAAMLLNRLMIDILIGSRSIEIFEAFDRNTSILPQVYEGLRRMSHSHIILSLNKYLELYRAYHDVIPDSCRESCKTLLKIIQSRPIVDFRNRFIGHLLDNKTKRPIPIKELLDILTKIYGEDEGHFISWVNDRNKQYPDTVVSILERTRDEIMRENKISQKEIDQSIEQDIKPT